MTGGAQSIWFLHDPLAISGILNSYNVASINEELNLNLIYLNEPKFMFQ